MLFLGGFVVGLDFDGVEFVDFLNKFLIMFVLFIVGLLVIEFFFEFFLFEEVFVFGLGLFIIGLLLIFKLRIEGLLLLEEEFYEFLFFDEN